MPLRASLVAQTVKNLLAMQGTWVQSLGSEDPLEKAMALHSSILAWRIPRTEESGSMWSQRVADDWVINTILFSSMPFTTLRKMNNIVICCYNSRHPCGSLLFYFYFVFISFHVITTPHFILFPQINGLSHFLIKLIGKLIYFSSEVFFSSILIYLCKFFFKGLIYSKRIKYIFNK